MIISIKWENPQYNSKIILSILHVLFVLVFLVWIKSNKTNVYNELICKNSQLVAKCIFPANYETHKTYNSLLKVKLNRLYWNKFQGYSQQN